MGLLTTTTRCRCRNRGKPAQDPPPPPLPPPIHTLSPRPLTPPLPRAAGPAAVAHTVTAWHPIAPRLPTLNQRSDGVRHTAPAQHTMPPTLSSTQEAKTQAMGLVAPAPVTWQGLHHRHGPPLLCWPPLLLLARWVRWPLHHHTTLSLVQRWQLQQQRRQPLRILVRATPSPSTPVRQQQQQWVGLVVGGPGWPLLRGSRKMR